MPLSSSHLPSSLDTKDGPLSLNSRGRCRTLTWFKPDPRSATSNVSDTSVADMGGAQLPGQDIAREVIEHGGQIEPAPADDLQIGEVGLPKLVWGGRGIGEAIGRLHQDEGRARDQAMVLQEPINGGF